MTEENRKLPRAGDAIIYVDENGRRHNALVVLCTLQPGDDTIPLTLGRILHNGLMTQTGVPHRGSRERFYWCWPDEVGLAD